MTAPKKASAASTASPRGQARTVIYCHGISNMPPEGVLRTEWDRALFGADQGERTRMAYWVDRERYPQPAGVSTRAIGEDRATLQWAAADQLAISIQTSDAPAESRARPRWRRSGGRRWEDPRRFRWRRRVCGAR
jgi:hypothetical protein